MIVVLDDELGHLTQSVFPGFFSLHEHGNEGDLRPEHHAGFVTEGVEVLVMLVVGEADAVDAHLADDGEILLVIRARDGPALVQPVLMTRHAVERIAAPVEEKALVGVDGERAEAEEDLHPVELLAVPRERDRRGVAARGVEAVPEKGRVDPGLEHGVLLSGGGAGEYGFSVGIQNGAAHRRAARVRCEGVQAHAAVGLRGDEHAVGAMEHQVKVARRHLDQRNVPVQAAEEGEVRLLGIDVARAVVHHHPDLPAAARHRLGYVRPEGGEAALMRAEQRPAGVDAGNVVGSLKLEVLTHPIGGLGQSEGIGISAAVVVGAAVLAVEGVPGVGEGHRLPPAGVRLPGEQCLRYYGCASHCVSSFLPENITGCSDVFSVPDAEKHRYDILLKNRKFFWKLRSSKNVLLLPRSVP